MATIGYATLQIIPSLKGVSEAIEKQVAGKVVAVSIEPQVDQQAVEKAGKQAKEGVEKHTREVKVEPKVDQRAAEDAGKKTSESVAKGVSGSSSAVGQAITGVLEGAGGEAGLRLGEKLAELIPTGMTGAAQRIGTALRNSLPSVGQVAGTMLGTAIGIAVTDAIGKERLDKAGRAVLDGLTKAVKAANTGTDIGVAIANSVAGGLSKASGAVGGAAAKLSDTIGGIGSAIGTAKEFLGGDDSWAAPGLDALNNALGKAGPLLDGVSSAALLASTGAQAISGAAAIATKAQLLWNAALVANPIGLIVTAIAAVVAGLVLFFTKTELGRKIWEGFTEYLKVAWEAIKTATGAVVSWFTDTAWPAIQTGVDGVKAVWQGLVTKAGEVWQGIKDKFTAVVDFVKGLPAAISAAASGMWDGIGNAFKSVIDRMKGWWNDFAGALSFTTPDWLPGDPVSFSLPTFGAGGYTGNIPFDRIAGVVHGGEFVVRKESTERIQNALPGLLDYLNNNGALPLPGYASGGVVALGNISGPGITTGEQQSMWDAVRTKFPDAVLSSATRTEMTEGHPDFHNAGRAIDISGPSMGRIASWIASNFPDSMELIHKPFGHNIKWGKNVGDGEGFYGAGLMAGHQDHVHWALGHTAKVSAPAAPAASAESATSGGGKASAPSVSSALGIGTAAAASPSVSSESAASSAPAAASSSGGGGLRLSAPSSLSGFGSWGGQFGGDQLGGAISDAVTGGGKQELDPRLKSAVGELGDLGAAAGSFVDGQIGSALGVLGAGTSPGWLKGISTLVSGFSVGGKTGSVGGSPGAGAALSGQGAAAAPLAAQTANIGAPATSALGTVHGTQGGQQPGGGGPTYNIRTATVEDAFLQAQRRENERSAAKLAHF